MGVVVDTATYAGPAGLCGICHGWAGDIRRPSREESRIYGPVVVLWGWGARVIIPEILTGGPGHWAVGTAVGGPKGADNVASNLWRFHEGVERYGLRSASSSWTLRAGCVAVGVGLVLGAVPALQVTLQMRVEVADGGGLCALSGCLQFG